MRPWIPESAIAESPHEAARGRVLASLLRQPVGAFGLAVVLLWLVVGSTGPLLLPYDSLAVGGPALAPPGALHLMGTDALGRDLLRALILASRTSLVVAGAVGLMALVVGMTVGIVAGYLGGAADDVLMRCTEFFQVVPRFFLAVLTIALFGPGLDRIILVLGLTSWPLLARVVRVEVLRLKEQEFVLASVALGASASRIIMHKLVPNALPPALVILGLLIGQVLLLEASLAFIGLGDPGAISWGSLAGQANPFIRVAWWLALFPGLAIAGAVLGFNLLADSLGRVLAVNGE